MNPSPERGEQIWGVCVTFDPAIPVFTEVVSSAKAQLAGMVVVDNGSGSAGREAVRDLCGQAGVRTVFLEANRGLACALNIGAAEALSQGASDILFLDHDSVPQAGMVAAMLSARQMLVAQRRPIGALGATAVDSRTGRASPFVRFSILGLRRFLCGNSRESVIATDMLNTSGSLIAADVLATVGQMDESLFIDHVDTDWCLRARAAGFSLFGVCGARLSHRLGDEVIELGFPVGRSIHVHPPGRFHFYVRNSLLLYFRPHAPLKWALPDAARLLLFIVFYCVFPRRRVEYVGATMQAMRDAFARLMRPSGN